MIENP